MLKVIIADDEEKICQLIEHLVDWKSLGMQVAGIAHNGYEALELIERESPDIAITDIRMPGYDGLEMIRRAKEINRHTEFIIISGYRHFEYAQSAIRYGVSDYLLKPVKKEELVNTLTRMKEEYLQKTEQLTFEEKVLLAYKNDVGKLRTSFFSSILYARDKISPELEPDLINRDYHYTFQPGNFRIIGLKLDGIGEVFNSSLEFLAEKVTKSLREGLRDCCYDYEIYFESSRSYCLINYHQNERKNVRRQLKSVLDELMVQESIFEGLRVTIGIGTPVTDIGGVRESKKSADWAIEQRLVQGTDRLIEGGEVRPTDLANSELFHEFNKNMNAVLERLDTQALTDVIKALKTNLLNREGITGHEILQMTKEVCNLYLFYMRNNKLLVENGDSFLETFNTQANGFYRIDDLFDFLLKEILQSLGAVIEDKKLEDNRPIRIAKQYIQENYSCPLTLEEVSNVVGFNTTYFSSLFKKETGSTFLEYLSEIRMEQAKTRLKESNDSVAAVCEQVGYSDVKHFTKGFIKHTGLKPNEYRKLYS